ncbi:hypothetical protein C8T65DRAFT_743914 [Cerioporus squamosus]|nr:hypothetical protein C8T65DRAFT_743914 [Cerioporus squamosus]
MAAAAPSHRIHTIHGAFGAPSRYAHSSSLMNPAQASWNRIPNVCAPRRTYELAPTGRTTPASCSAAGAGAGAGSTSTGLSTGLGMRSASGSRPRRTTMSAGSWGSPLPPRRAPPPPPAPAERTTSALATSAAAAVPDLLPKVVSIPAAGFTEDTDPFADAADDSDLSPFPPAPFVSSRTRVAVPSYSSTVNMSCARASLAGPPGLVPSAKDVRGRLVATTLLNRGSGRPLGVYLRRRLSGEGTTYVKSGLSRLVAAAA